MPPPHLEYTAKCYNGVAKIDVFAYDCSFVDVPDIVIPDACEAWTDDGKKNRVPLHDSVRP